MGPRRKILLGNQLTEADIRLYTTIIRFDPVYVQHFKCNIGTIRTHYPYIHNWLRLLYWKIPGFKKLPISSTSSTTTPNLISRLIHTV